MAPRSNIQCSVKSLIRLERPAIAGGFSASSSLSNGPPGINAPDVDVPSNTRKCILNTCTLSGDLRMINRVVCSRMNRGQPLRGWLMVPKKRSTTCPILQRSGSELFSSRKYSHRFMYLCDSSMNSRKGLSEGPKCKTVSPQGASRVPGIDLSTILQDSHVNSFIATWTAIQLQ
jgi:hypothetical protein